jgi:hypothetical protein
MRSAIEVLPLRSMSRMSWPLSASREATIRPTVFARSSGDAAVAMGRSYVRPDLAAILSAVADAGYRRIAT